MDFNFIEKNKIKYYSIQRNMQNKNSNSDSFKFPNDLPIENIRDFLAVAKQDIKYFYIPFNFYHKIRVNKYMKKSLPELALIQFLCNNNGNAIDVGANLGLYSYLISKYSKQLHAFEPNPYPLRYLKRLNKGNTKVYPIAVGSVNDDVELFIPKKPKGWTSNGASLRKLNLGKGLKFKVACRTIDYFNFKDVELIKIDVEGCEQDVIDGAINTIKNWTPNIIIENEIVHTSNPFSVLNNLLELGYKAYYCKNEGELIELDDQFDFKKNQLNPSAKDKNYIQNFIMIHKNKLDFLRNSINFKNE